MPQPLNCPFLSPKLTQNLFVVYRVALIDCNIQKLVQQTRSTNYQESQAASKQVAIRVDEKRFIRCSSPSVARVPPPNLPTHSKKCKGIQAPMRFLDARVTQFFSIGALAFLLLPSLWPTPLCLPPVAHFRRRPSAQPSRLLPLLLNGPLAQVLRARKKATPLHLRGPKKQTEFSAYKMFEQNDA